MPVVSVDNQTDEPTLRKRMTLAEFNALPDDPERDRSLILGELWDHPSQPHHRDHALAAARLAYHLCNWEQSIPGRKFDVFSGEVGCDLPESESGFGIDVAVFSAETLARQDPTAPYIDGVPILAVEIVSPSDTVELLDAKTQSYLDAGVPWVWIVNTLQQTVTVHSPGVQPKKLRLSDDLVGDPHLPGLHIPVRTIFE